MNMSHRQIGLRNRAKNRAWKNMELKTIHSVQNLLRNAIDDIPIQSIPTCHGQLLGSSKYMTS